MAMSDPQKDLLRRNRVYLVEHLQYDIQKVVDHLVTRRILDQSHEEQILDKSKSREESVRTLLQIIPSRGKRGYDNFMEILKENLPFAFEDLNQDSKEQSRYNYMNPSNQVMTPW